MPWRRESLDKQERIEREVDKYLKRGVIERVPRRLVKWQSAVVLVKKGEDDVRLCVDMRQVNKAVLDEKYPLLTIEELQGRLAGSTLFSVLDLKDAFHHIELDEDAKDLTTFVTTSGAYRFRVLTFGLKTASEIFQKIMMQIVLLGLLGLAIYIDDIIVYGKTVEEHDERLRLLLERLRQ